MTEKRVQCPACSGVGFIRKNRVGDPFLTCTNCGPWNGRGPKFRGWCDSLPALNEPDSTSTKPKPHQVQKPDPETKPEPVPANAEDDNWLANL